MDPSIALAHTHNRTGAVKSGLAGYFHNSDSAQLQLGKGKGRGRRRKKKVGNGRYGEN